MVERTDAIATKASNAPGVTVIAQSGSDGESTYEVTAILFGNFGDAGGDVSFDTGEVIFDFAIEDGHGSVEVNKSADDIGDAFIGPYYTTRGGWTTLELTLSFKDDDVTVDAKIDGLNGQAWFGDPSGEAGPPPVIATPFDFFDL